MIVDGEHRGWSTDDLLLDQPNDLIEIVAKALGTPLVPKGCVMLASTCHALRAMLNAHVTQLKTLHAKACTLCEGKAGNIRNRLRSGPHRYDGTEGIFLDTGNNSRFLPLNYSRLTLSTATVLVITDGALLAQDCRVLAELVACGSLDHIAELSLWDNFVGHSHSGAVALHGLFLSFAGGTLPKLEGLNLCRNGIIDDSLQTLTAVLKADPKHILPSLVQLNLDGNHIGSSGTVQLVEALALGALPRLGYLNLEDNCIGDAGLKAFIACGTKGTLVGLLSLSLQIENAGITVSGVDALAAALRDGALPSLEWLNLPAALELRASLRDVCGARGIHQCIESEDEDSEDEDEGEGEDEGEDEDEI